MEMASNAKVSNIHQSMALTMLLQTLKAEVFNVCSDRETTLQKMTTNLCLTFPSSSGEKKRYISLGWLAV